MSTKLIQSLRVDPTTIKIGERLRELSEEGVQTMIEGATPDVLPPIVIRKEGKDHWLVAGRHRLEVALRLKWGVIRADLFAFEHPEEVTIMEIEENLKRVELGAADKKMHVLEYAKAHASIKVRAKAEQDRIEAEKAEAEAKAKGEAVPGKVREKKSQAVKAARQPNLDAVQDKLTGKSKAKAAVVADLSRATGLKSETISREISEAAAIERVAPGALKAIRGTTLDNRDETRELAKLAKTQPEVVRNAVNAAKMGEAVHVAPKPGKNAKKETNAPIVAAKKEAKLETKEGQAELVAKRVVAFSNAHKEALDAAHKYGFKTIAARLQKIEENVASVLTLSAQTRINA